MYNHVNGTDISHSVWMAIGDASVRSQLPVTESVGLFGEVGLGVVNRIGFQLDNSTIVSHANFATPIFGAGISYRMNSRWDAVITGTYVPENTEKKQPAIGFGSLGFRYNMRPLPVDRVEEARAAYIFPANLVQVAFVTNAAGYGANAVVSGAVPIFWGGHVEVARGGTLRYQRNIFHTRSRLAIDIGTSVSMFKTNLDKQNFVAASIFPVLRWTFLRTQTADVFLSYSIAGPAYLSKRVMDGEDLGNRFTFQDVLGFGMFVNQRRNTFIQIDVGHFSNGNFFASNPGVKIPTTIAIGKGF
jgi:hypothetical protein